MKMRAGVPDLILGGFGLRQSTFSVALPLHLGNTHLDKLVYSFHLFTLGDIEADFLTPSPPMIFT